jgi:hypothetical protein
LLCHADGLPEAKQDVYSLSDTAMSLSGLPNADEVTLSERAQDAIRLRGKAAGFLWPIYIHKYILLA